MALLSPHSPWWHGVHQSAIAVKAVNLKAAIGSATFFRLPRA